MRHTINQVEEDELYLEINRVESPNGGYYLKLFRQYKKQEPEVKFQAYLTKSDLNNFIIGLQKASLYQKDLCPLEPDLSKNFGQH